MLGQASHFVWLNRGKESVALDLKDERGRDVLARLVGRADVFLHNLGPGAVDRLGFPSTQLRQQHPRLVICAMSGYGSTGPYRDKRAYDLLVQSEAGLVAVTGTPEHPAKAGIPVADIASGMYASMVSTTASGSGGSSTAAGGEMGAASAGVPAGAGSASGRPIPACWSNISIRRCELVPLPPEA